MKINKAELQKALEIVKPGLANKEIIEQATSFAFINDRVVTYNDMISISHPVPGLKIQGAIKAEKLYGFISKVKKDHISIKADDNQLKMVVGNAKAGLAFQSKVVLPLDDELGTKGKWKSLPEGFREAVELTWPNCSIDMTNPILVCVNIRKDGRIEASDRTRLISYEIGELPIPGFLLPGSSARELVRLKITHIARGKGWAHFKTEEGTIFSCRIYQGEFPDATSIYQVEGAKITFPEGITEAIQRAQVFAKADHINDEWVEIDFTDGEMTIKYENESEWFNESIKSDYSGEPIEFKITPSFLLQILQSMKECIKGENLLKFSSDKWTFIIAHKAG